MHILCPHCRNSVALVKLDPREEVVCPSCGSSFSLETESTIAPDPSSGQKLRKYELLCAVGQGAFGTVSRAHDPELDRLVAIKVPRAHARDGARALKPTPARRRRAAAGAAGSAAPAT